ncbi:HEPN domain-containing protein [Spirochaeta thermophila]|uniref:Putative hepn domain protein n=1 Tax=Winmispira thermophila (strain ATCC 49972 / DSM 6192 / RI 19.B1) TaxID=665571 RepID=E0RU86_WINT6|nr:HEPN domain-containing protein [Spirochaeta thermophila]ADN02307.1 putative hepn domain protein [Spirochaeta thermophila DSM 6192]
MNRWRDWYSQGVRDLEKACLDAEEGYHEWACFTAQQAAEKVTKALALRVGVEVWGHSVREILQVVSERVHIPPAVMDAARILDLYYIPPRYPNGFPSGRPADYFTRRESEEALRAARTILAFCEGVLSGERDA